MRDRQSGTIERMSVNSSGVQGNSGSSRSAISADGRYVVFLSSSTNLVAGDTNNQFDVFVRDRHSGTTERVNVDSAGVQANSFSDFPNISADGRYVVFESNASNLVAGDTPDTFDVFVHDRQTGVTEKIDAGLRAALNADGRYVAYESPPDVLLRDRQTNTTERIGKGGFPSISADGRYVAFMKPGSPYTILVHDRQTDLDIPASVTSAGTPAEGIEPAISADGRLVAFMSSAVLVSNDTNGVLDVYVYDLATEQTQLASVNSSGVVANANDVNADNADPSISADGRFVSFSSTATNLAPNDPSADPPDAYVHEFAAPAPMLFTLTPDSIDFGRVVRSMTSTRAVELENTSGGTLPIQSIALGGQNKRQFAFTSHCGSSLASGASCQIDVVFKPTTYKVKAASLIVTMGSGAGSKSVSLTGNGVPVKYTFVPFQFPFGPQTVGTVSNRQFIILRNDSGAPMPLYGISIGGADPSQFGFNTTCGSVIVDRCTIGVAFKPTSVGVKNAVISVSPPGVPNRTLSLSGEGT